MTAVLRIRLATPADLSVLHALVEQAYRGDSARAGWTHEADLVEGDRTTPQALAEIVADPAQEMLLAFDGDDLVGCVLLADQGGGLGYLGMLCVRPALQAAGLGKALIAAAEREARTRYGADRMEMCVISRRAELIAYYQRRGYGLTGEARRFPVPMDPPLTLLVMEKPLS